MKNKILTLLLVIPLFLVSCQKKGEDQESVIPQHSDEESETESEESQAEHKHKYSSDWSYDHHHHWHECICHPDEKPRDYGEHEFSSEEVTDEDGQIVTRYTCDICEYTYDDAELCRITWLNWDDEVIYSELYPVGATPSYDFEKYGTPRKVSEDPLVGYEFDGWEPEIVEVSVKTSYKAKFKECEPFYIVKWLNWDGTLLEEDSRVAANAIPEYNGETPVREADEEYTYTFSGWDPDPTEPVLKDVSFVAQYDGAINHYAIRWVNVDDSLILEETYAYGETPEFKGANPTYSDDNPYYYYSFKGWEPEIVPVTKAATYKAPYDHVSAINHFSFTLDSETDSYQITGLTEPVQDLYIPATYNDKYITSIKANAFDTYVNTIKSIQFQDGNQFTTLPESLFSRQENLVSADLGNTQITSIPNKCFYGTKLSTISLPTSLITIGDYVFCATSIVMIDLVNTEEVGESVFENCASLTTVKANSLLSIGKNAFNSYSSALTSFQDDARGNITIGERAFVACNLLSSFTLKKAGHLYRIGSSAFLNCEQLKIELDLSYATYIGVNAFYNSGVSKATIVLNSSHTNYMGSLSYSNITYLDYTGNARLSILYNLENYQDQIGWNLKTVRFVGTSTCSAVPNYFLSGGRYIYGSNNDETTTSVENVYFKGTVTSIGDYAFYNCNKLEYLTNHLMQTSVTSIGNYAFAKSGLKELDFPDTVTTIGSRILNGNTTLTTLGFTGTSAQWNAITKNSDWKAGSALTKVVCSGDGVTINL